MNRAQPGRIAHAAVRSPARTGSSSRRRTSRRRPRPSRAGSGAAAASPAPRPPAAASAPRARATRGGIAEKSGSAAPRRASASNPRSARRPPRFLCYRIGHVGAAHQRTAEHHLEAERQAVFAITLELRAARYRRPPADCGGWAGDTGRWWRRPCPPARRSRSSACTSSSVSPSPTMKPDLVSASGACRRANASTSSDCR